MSFSFDNMWGVPGTDEVREVSEVALLWGPFARQVWLPCAIQKDSVDSAQTPTDLLRAGTLMAKVLTGTYAGQLVPWSPTHSTTYPGIDTIYGILLYELKMNLQGTAVPRFVGPVLVAGQVHTNILVQAGVSAAGLNGMANELEIRAQLTSRGRFLLDDEPWGASMAGYRRIVDLSEIHASAYTVLESDNGTLFHTAAVVGNYTVTLPSPAANLIGMAVSVAVAGNALTHDITISCATADSIITFNDLAADSIAFTGDTTAVGAVVDFVCISATKWLSIPRVWPGNVATIAT